jgi:hypothetical protein
MLPPFIGTWLQQTNIRLHANVYHAIARALGWLCPPPNMPIDRLRGGLAPHKLFQSTEAPVKFASIDAVERFVNKVRLHFATKFQVAVHHELI